MALLEMTGLDWRIAFTAVAALVWLASNLYAWRIPQGKGFTWVSLAATALIAAGLWIPVELGRTVLMDAAALLIAIFVRTQNRRAGNIFLAAVISGAVLAAAGMALGGFFAGAAEPAGATAKIVVALIVLGFAFKLALVPFSFWMAPMADSASPLTAVLVISVLDMAEFGELALLRVDAPWIFDSAQALWITLALLSMFGGAFLALAQKNLRRMLAFSTIDDMGYLLLGLILGSAGGVLGALIGALSHAVCKFLLFGAVGVAEHDAKHPITLDDRGLACRNPVASAAFVAGALGMIGVPPFLGFLGRWRLYLSGLELGGPALVAAMAVATAIALLYYVRAIHQVWFGKQTAESASEPQSFPGIRVILVAGMALLLIMGLFPALFPGLGGR